MKRLRYGLVLLAVGCSPASAEPEPVELVDAPTRSKQARTPEHEPVLGLVLPRWEIELVTVTPGRIEELPAGPGIEVDAGQVVARLSNPALETARDEAKARLRGARTEVELRRQDRRWARDREDQVEALGDVASTDERREAVHQRSRAEVETLGARAAVEATRHQLRASSSRLEALELRAQRSGVVSRVHRALGDWIEIGEPVVRLISRELAIRTAIDVDRAACLSPGDEVAVVTEATGDALTMTVERVAPDVDAAGMVIVEGTLPSTIDPERVRPGMLVDVRLLADASKFSARFCPP